MKEIALKPLVPGNFSGTMMVAAKPLSFFGDIDVKTGTVVAPDSDLHGKSLKGVVLCLTATRGSAGAWRVLSNLGRLKTGPVGIIVRELPDPTFVQGAIMGDIPVVRVIDEPDFARLANGGFVTVRERAAILEA